MVERCVNENFGGIAGHYMLMTKKIIRRLRAHDKKIGVGFIPNANLFRREWGMAVDWVFTNHAAQVLAIDSDVPHNI